MREIIMIIKIIGIVLVIATLLPLLLWCLGLRVEWVGIIIALLIGIGAMIQSQIIKWIFPPLFETRVRGVETKTKDGHKIKCYLLSLKNKGFSSAKNIKVKIRDKEDKAWINLIRPFADFRDGKDKVSMNNLSVGEEDDFSLGEIAEDNKFRISVNISPHNQMLVIEDGQEVNYYLEIVADNTTPCSFQVFIKNNKFGQSELSPIIIIERF